LKKGKTSSRQSEKKGLKVLVPLLSKREDSEEFVASFSGGASEIILLLVIDTGAMSGGFGFAAGEIALGNSLMQRVKAGLAKRKKQCKDIIEWGNTESKIEHLAKFHAVDKVCLVRQHNQFFEKLLSGIKENLGIEVEVVELPEKNRLFERAEHLKPAFPASWRQPAKE